MRPGACRIVPGTQQTPSKAQLLLFLLSNLQHLAPCFLLLENGMLCRFEGLPSLSHKRDRI